MKKLSALVFVLSLALVLSNVSFAQETDAAPQEAAMMIADDGSAPQMMGMQQGMMGMQHGMQDCCGPVMPYGHCRPFARRACMPCYANPCNPCPPQQMCGGYQGCGQPACGPSPCGFGGYGYGYGGCGAYGYHATPIRNFFARIFSPRPYCGYDAYYGPSGFGYGNGGCCGGY